MIFLGISRQRNVACFCIQKIILFSMMVLKVESRSVRENKRDDACKLRKRRRETGLSELKR